MKSPLHAVTNGIVSVCALTGLGLVLGGALGRPAPRLEPDVPVAEWPALIAGGQHVGPSDAPVVLVTFSDFQCPYCARLAALLAELRAQQPGAVRMVYRHLPLQTIHPHARAAAVASECAAEQGRFETFHDTLYQRQAEIGTTAWLEFAAGAGVPDTAAFAACVAADRYGTRVDADAALAEGLGITGTPTVFLNGVQLRDGSPAVLRRRIAAALEAAR